MLNKITLSLCEGSRQKQRKKYSGFSQSSLFIQAWTGTRCTPACDPLAAGSEKYVSVAMVMYEADR